jgi:CRISPR-associated protein Cmr4
MVLRRLARDAREAGAQAPDLPAMSDQRVAAAEAQGTPSAVAAGGHVLLEDLKLTVEPTSANLAYGWADWLGKRVFPGAPGWQVALARRFLVVTDDVFSYLAQTGTQVDARVRLDDDTKTVARGALWYEESLPAESILAGLVAAEPVTRGRDSYDEGKFLDLIATRTGKTMQLGGKAGVGRGLVRFVCAAEQGKKP